MQGGGTPMITHVTMPPSGMERICVSRPLMMCVRDFARGKKLARECGLLATTTEVSSLFALRRLRNIIFQIGRREPSFSSK